MKRILLGSVGTIALCLPVHAAVVYSGFDSGAGSLAAAPNATAAAASFAAALTSSTVVDFEGSLGDFSFTADGLVRNSQRCAAELCGYNTTSGGSYFLEVTYNTTFNFASPIEAFGAYFTGVQRADATLTYTDGTTTTVTLPAAEISFGGTTFFGFTDFGASIVSIDYFTGTGGDYVGVDDITYQVSQTPAVPLPATLPLLAAGFGALAIARRKT